MSNHNNHHLVARLWTENDDYCTNPDTQRRFDSERKRKSERVVILRREE